MKLKHYLPLFLLFVSINAQSQVLITILFGEKLNSPNVEFGLDGGFNQSYFRDVSSAEALNHFNLGFYFHILLKNNSYLSTGLQVKSNVGATGMPTYSIGNSAFDSIYQDGTLTTKINYFYLPVLYQHRIYKYIQLEGGFQAGLRTKATDAFSESAYGGELSYEKEVRANYTHLDAGLLGGFGIKLKDQPKSMSIGVNYYYGLVNISTIDGQKIRNSSVYIYMKIPIGVGSPKS